MMYLILDELKKKSAKAEVNTRQNQQYSLMLNSNIISQNKSLPIYFY